MKIIQEHSKCIGCGACVALCAEFWEMGEGGEAHPRGGKQDSKTGNYELEIEKIGCNKEAVDSCPVQIIRIVK